MTVIKFLLIILYIFACGTLIFVVLLQQGRGATMGATLGGGASETLFGSRTSSFITRFTAAMAGVYMILAMVLAKYPPFSADTSSDVRDILTPEEVQPAPAESPAAAVEEVPAPPAAVDAAPTQLPAVDSEAAPDEALPATPTTVEPAHSEAAEISGSLGAETGAATEAPASAEAPQAQETEPVPATP